MYSKKLLLQKLIGQKIKLGRGDGWIHVYASQAAAGPDFVLKSVGDDMFEVEIIIAEQVLKSTGGDLYELESVISKPETQFLSIDHVIGFTM